MTNYNVPPPWDPGFALPPNVQAEGLERRAFITKWMPRGTYEMADLGPMRASQKKPASWAIPQYIWDEGYGQGVFVTDWLPSKTYIGPRVPDWNKMRTRTVGSQKLPDGGTALTMAVPTDAIAKQQGGRLALSGLGQDPSDPFPEPYQSYGVRAATAILRKIAQFPSPQRKAMLKRMLDAIDPTLWDRAAKLTRRYANKGLSTAAALQMGIARGLAAGIYADVARTGSSSQPARIASLQVSAGRSALGGTAASRAGFDVSAGMLPVQPQIGECTSDGQLIWRGDHWEHPRAGEQCASVGTFQHDVGTGPGGGVTVDGKPACITPDCIDAVVPKVLVGPFKVPFHTDRWTMMYVKGVTPMPDEITAIVLEALSKDTGSVTTSMRPATDGHPYAVLKQFFGEGVPQMVNQDYIVRAPAGFGTSWKTVYDPTKAPTQSGAANSFQVWDAYWEDMSDFNPILATKHPITGDDFGVYMWIAPMDLKKAWDADTNPWVLRFIWRRIDQHWYSKVWNFIKKVVATLEDNFCKLHLSGGGKAASSSGNPYAMAASAIADQLCKTPDTKPDTSQAGKSDWFLPVAIGGGLLALYLLMSPPKKKAPPP